MNIELTRIAEKKLEQMGATVHGVLVKNEAGAWAAVSDAGRVMWLDDFEGQAATDREDALDCALSGQSYNDRLIDSVCAELNTMAFELKFAHTVAGEWPASARDTLENHDHLKRMAVELRKLKAARASSAGAVPEAQSIINRVVAELEVGFVACNRCGDQEDTATLDCMDDLKLLQSLLTAAPTAPVAEDGGVLEKGERGTLLPCPCCGGKPREYDRIDANVVTCTSCGLRVRQSELGRGDADIRWNRRTTRAHNGEQGGEWVIQLRGDYLVTRGVWERPDHRGYTNDIHEAGRYSEDEAKKAEGMAPDKYKAVCLARPNPPSEREGE